jgi:hypothetical protein
MLKGMLGLKVILLIVFIGVASFATFASAESSEKIPSWVKTIAGLWANDVISDDEYLEIMQFLVDNRLLQIPQERVYTDTSFRPAEQINPVLSTNPFPKPTLQYTPGLAKFEEDGKYIKALITLKSRDGSYTAKDGKFSIVVLNAMGQEVYSDRKYVYKISFDEYSMPNDNNKIERGFEWNMFASKFKGTATHSGTVHLTFHDKSGTNYKNTIPFENMPFDYPVRQSPDSSFPNYIEVDENLVVGPFLVTVNNVGPFQKQTFGQSEEFFRVDLSVQNNRGSPVKFVIEDVVIMDQNLKLYSSNRESMESLEELILPLGIREGSVLFEKIPSHLSKIKLFLSIEVLEDINLTDSYKYNDVLEISLR